MQIVLLYYFLACLRILWWYFGQEGEQLKAVVYLELATRAGETAAAHVKNVILQQLSATSRDRVMNLADNWRALPSSRWVIHPGL